METITTMCLVDTSKQPPNHKVFEGDYTSWDEARLAAVHKMCAILNKDSTPSLSQYDILKQELEATTPYTWVCVSCSPLM